MSAAAPAATRPADGQRWPTLAYRVVLPDGTEKIERVIGLSEIAAYYPQAVQVTRCDWGGFW